MYETVVVPFDDEYGDEHSDPNIHPNKVIFKHASVDHITITVVDPKIGVSAEAIIRKDALPAFVTDPKAK